MGNEVPTVKDDAYFVQAFEAVQHLIKSDLISAGHDISEGGLITTLLEMCFARPATGLTLDLHSMGDDLIKILFSENPGLVFQTTREDEVLALLSQRGVKAQILGHVSAERKITVHFGLSLIKFNIDELRDVWFKTSYLLDAKQRPEMHAEKRYQNYKNQLLSYDFPATFKGTFNGFGIDPARRAASGIKAAIIREKGVNGDREMAYTLYLAGFDVKDIHMTDLVSGREDLSDVNMIVFVGGFSNSDVLGSAKGWAGAFLYNPKAKQSLANFYNRSDTLSLGVCNGCQLMMELGLVYPEWKDHPRMNHNGSGKFESTFVNVTIPANNSVLLSSMKGARLGVWVAHGEGRFRLPEDNSLFQVAAKFSYHEYPGNPNDSDFDVAALCSKDGRHLAIMPHLERSLFPWNWPYYPSERKADEISPWMEPFVNAKAWIKKHFQNV